MSLYNWTIEKEDLHKQVTEYDTLKVSETYRGISFYLILFTVVITLGLSAFNFYGLTLTEGIYSSLVYLSIGYFVYKGHRWAIIGMMILWTFEKGYQLVTATSMHTTPIVAIIWWAIYMQVFYKALKVENERVRLHPNKKVHLLWWEMLLLGFMFVLFILSLWALIPEEPYTPETLTKEVEKFKKDADLSDTTSDPHPVDIRSEGMTVVYSFQYNDYKDNYDFSNTQQNLRNDIIKNACDDSDIRDMLDRDVSFKYTFNDVAGTNVFSEVISKEDCKN